MVEDAGGFVARGYDLIARRYADATIEARSHVTYYKGFLDRCRAMVPGGGRILDLGCGAGIVTEELAQWGSVVGADLSFEQLRLARARVPRAALVQADMTRLGFIPGSFDAVAAFWSVIHVPRELHAPLLAAVHAWLRPGGVLFGTFGSGDNPSELDGDFFGAPMYWSHFDAETNRGLLRDAGFTVLQADVVEDAGEHPLWVIATA